MKCMYAGGKPAKVRPILGRDGQPVHLSDQDAEWWIDFTRKTTAGCDVAVMAFEPTRPFAGHQVVIRSETYNVISSQNGKVRLRSKKTGQLAHVDGEQFLECENIAMVENVPTWRFENLSLD